MNKAWLASLLVLAASTGAHAFEKLPPQYQIHYGDEQAKTKIVEYFSLSCAKCRELFKEDFLALKKEHIDTGKVYWTFHPDPADLLTVQAMACLEKLDEEKKRIFLEAVLEHISKTSKKHGYLVMKAAMDALGSPMPDLENIDALEKSAAFADAFAFLKQEDVIKIIPTVEIDGKICDAFPSREFLNQKIAEKRLS